MLDLQIDHIDGRSLKESLHVLRCRLDETDAGFGSGPCDVGCDIGVGSLQERVIRRWRLAEEHIGPISTQMAGTECVCHVILIDKRSTACVDDDGALFHLRDGLGTDDFPGIVVERTVKGDDVGNGEQSVERGFLNALGQ